MAKTVTPVEDAAAVDAAAVEAVPALDKNAVAEMIEAAFKEKRPDLREMIEKIATQVAEKEIADALVRAKRWGRREIELNASGASHGEREDMNQ